MLSINFTSHAALRPGRVKDLSVTIDETVTLSWKQPVNIQTSEEVSEYQVRFKPTVSWHYKEIKVKDSSCTAIIDVTQESGLVSSRPYTFEVRARNICGEGEWQETSAFCGMLASQEITRVHK